MPFTKEGIKDLYSTEQKRITTAAVLRRSLKRFIAVFHFHIHGKEFIFKPFHDLIIEKLVAIVLRRSKKKNLIINMPPRYGKSIIVQYFIAWCYSINDSSQFIYTSYSDNLVLSFSNKIKETIGSELFMSLFHCRLGNTGARHWSTVNGGSLYASAQGGAITGFGAGVVESTLFGGALIIDDPIKPIDCRSITVRNKVIEYYTETLSNRLNSPDTPIIVIMQRLHKEDLVGYILENEAEDYEYLKISAVNETETDTIWPEKHPIDVLLKVKNSRPEYYYGQYQQEPIIVGGNIIKEDWFSFYAELPKMTYTFITTDTAQKIKEKNDHTVFSLWGFGIDNRLYLLNMFKGKLEAPELRKKALGIWRDFSSFITGIKCRYFYIEDKSSGTGLIQELKRVGGIPVKAIPRTTDKYTRCMDCAPEIEAGNVLLPLNALFTKDCIAEAIAFTANDSHEADDFLDTMFDAIDITFNKEKKKLEYSFV